ncbi:MAG TPA: hypothetical protein P5121_24470, partial [Caldilineaceae bacterium]|nr:hypothetical protein [Caldilineaceae bacterium]
MQTHIAFLSTEQKARSNGIRVLEPPADTRQAVRGNLYAVIEIAANTPDQSQLIEQALSVIQRNYYSIKGTQTFVLTESLRGAMELFQSIAPSPEQSAAAVSTQRSRSTVSPPGILLFSLTGNRLMAVGSGPIIALVTTGSNVDVYPNYTPGVERPANMPIEIYRQELTRGGAFLLAGQRCLQHFTLRELASIVAYVTEDNLADVAAALRSQAEPELLTGLIAVISPDDSDESDEPTRTSQSSATMSPPRRRGGLPAALSVSPPRRNITQRFSGTQPAASEVEPVRPARQRAPDATEAEMGEEAAGQQGGRPTHAPDTDHSQGAGESFAQRVQTLARQA